MSSKPPRVLWTFHGTAVVRDYARALDWLSRFCGCRALEYSDNRDPLVDRKGGVAWLGDNGLELMEPNSPRGGPGRFLRRFGTGIYALALQVPDAREAAEWLRGRGAGIVGDPERGFVFTQPRDTAWVYLEWGSAAWPFDPRFGAPLPPPEREPLIDVPRIASWGALVADPPAALARLRELWPAPVLVERPDAEPERPAAALSIADGALQLYRLPPDPGTVERLWGPIPPRPRLHLMSLRVRDLPAAAGTLRREGVRVLRGDAASGEIVTHPDDTCGIGMSWTDRDVPGDPRGPLAG